MQLADEDRSDAVRRDHRLRDRRERADASVREHGTRRAVEVNSTRPDPPAAASRTLNRIRLPPLQGAVQCAWRHQGPDPLSGPTPGGCRSGSTAKEDVGLGRHPLSQLTKTPGTEKRQDGQRSRWRGAGERQSERQPPWPAGGGLLGTDRHQAASLAWSSDCQPSARGGFQGLTRCQGQGVCGTV
jgi:hypothetical protein